MSSRQTVRATPEQVHPRIFARPILDQATQAALWARMDEAESRLRRALDIPDDRETPPRLLAVRAARAFLASHPHEADVRKALHDLERAKHVIVEANMRLVVSIARRREFADRGLPLVDRVQEGTFGLMRATDGFDARRGYKFSTYATWWIRQFIQRALSEQSHTIRLPAGVEELLHQARKIRSETLTRDGREPETGAVAEMLGVTVERLESAFDAERAQPSSVNRPVGELGDGELLDLLRDDQVATPEEEAERHARERLAQSALATLGERDRLIVSLRFGIEDDDDKTLAEIGERLGLTRQRILKLEKNAMQKLRKRLP